MEHPPALGGWTYLDTDYNVLYCRSATSARWQQRYLEHGMAGIAPVHESATLYWWVARIVVWVQTNTPTHFGYLRSRWCCSTLALLLAREYNVQVSRETIRRYLHQSQLAWRRPRRTLRPHDLDYDQIVRKIKRLLNSLPSDEIVRFQDEAEVCTHPNIGSMGMTKGNQVIVETHATPRNGS